MRRSAGGSTAIFGPSRDDTGGWPDVSAGNPRVYARSSRPPAKARSVAGDVLDLPQALPLRAAEIPKSSVKRPLINAIAVISLAEILRRAERPLRWDRC